MDVGTPAPTPEKPIQQEKPPKQPRSSEATPRRVTKPSKKAAEAAAAGRNQVLPVPRNKQPPLPPSGPNSACVPWVMLTCPYFFLLMCCIIASCRML